MTLSDPCGSRRAFAFHQSRRRTRQARRDQPWGPGPAGDIPNLGYSNIARETLAGRPRLDPTVPATSNVRRVGGSLTLRLLQV